MSDVESLAKKWLRQDPDATTRAEIEGLVAAGDHAELAKRLSQRIEFGTAGLRGRMQAGYAFMNQLTVLQATQGVAEYLLEKFSDAKERGVVVGCDHRHNSAAFAKITTATLLHRGFRVLLLEGTVATPLVPYAVLQNKCIAGVMITASHNPKEDNGYKLYAANGAQIIAPVDSDISAKIAAHEEPWGVDVEKTLASAGEQLLRPIASVAEGYFADIERFCYHKEANHTTDFPITFTPMHGVGAEWVDRAFATFHLAPVVHVPLQRLPDPDFPTVAFPNPEEGKGALRLAIAAADAAGSTLVLANDPDADRLAVAEKVGSEWRVWTGNEIGVLLCWWCVMQYIAANPDVPREKMLVMNSTVSSKMISALARKEGIRYEETLTGFKWLGNLGARLRDEEGYHIVFAFEEAIGYLVGDTCLDKDGVRAAAVFAEMALWLRRTEGLSIGQKLSQLMDTYGHHVTRNSYFFTPDLSVMGPIMARLRDPYPTTCGPFAVKGVRDLERCTDSTRPDGKATLPKASRMLTFFFENGGVATIRASGTEPKLKYYVEMTGGASADAAATELKALTDAIVEHWLEPERNGLQPPATD